MQNQYPDISLKYLWNPQLIKTIGLSSARVRVPQTTFVNACLNDIFKLHDTQYYLGIIYFI